VNVYKRFARDTLIYGLASVLPRVVNVLLVSLHTKVLLPASYSVNTKFYVYIAFFNVLFTYGMETAFFRFFTMLDRDRRVLRTAFTSLLISSLFFTGLLWFFKDGISRWIGVSKDIYWIFLLILLLDTLMVIPYAWLRVMHRPYRFAFYRLSHTVIYAVFNVIFLLGMSRWLDSQSVAGGWFFSHSKVYYIFLANLIASGWVFLMFLPSLFKIGVGFDAALWGRMIGYGLPVMVAGVFYIINENFDKIALDKLAGPEVMGSYAAVYKIGVFMVLYITAFRLGAEPFYFNQSKHPDAKRQYAVIMSGYVLSASLLMMSVIVFLPWIVRIFIRNVAYLEALDIVPVILLAYLFLGIYFNLSIWYKLAHKTLFGTLFSAIGAVITVLINIYCIPRWGFMASAWATLAAYSVMTLVSYVTGRRYFPVPYAIGKISVYVILSAMISFVVYRYFYMNWTVKILLLLVFSLFVYLLEQKTIRQLLKNLSR